MAAPLLFEIAEIDLHATEVSADEVGEINPQCGDMRQLDRVAWLSDERDKALGLKQVHNDEFWVTGHIPGRPLLPGVLMIEAAAQLCSILYRKKSGETKFIGFTRCDDAVFRGQVVPGDLLVLLAREVSLRKRRFVSRSQGLIDGNLVFEAKITGMVM